ncbi:MAG: hypothetical protein IOD12_07710 [Silvanigrellales bacterium]|jgi:hypothetical protein|nr:hypothetical protein [Silvanigrellales bacterium]
MRSLKDILILGKIPALERVVYGNTLAQWFAAVVAALVVSFVLVHAKARTLKWIREKSASTNALWDDDASTLVSKTQTGCFKKAAIASFSPPAAFLTYPRTLRKVGGGTQPRSNRFLTSSKFFYGERCKKRGPARMLQLQRNNMRRG